MSDTQTIPPYPLLDDARLQQKLHMVNIATWVLRIRSSSAHIAASAAMQNLLGYTAGNSENNWNELVESRVHPDDREFLRQEIAASSSSAAHTIQIEYRIWNERLQRWHEIFLFGSRDSYDAATATAVLSGGIQDRQSQRDSQRLREHQHLLNSTLIANLPGSYVIAASNEKLVRWNEHFQNNFSLHTVDPSECPFSSLFLPEVQQKATQVFHSILATGAEVAKLPALRSDGSRGIFTVYGRRLVTENERFVLAMLFDSTEAEAMQTALVVERTRLDAVLDAAHLGIWDWNVSTDKAHFNKITAGFFGMELSAIQGSFGIWEKVIAAGDYSRVAAAMEAHFRGETEMFSCELRLQQPGGKFLWVQCRGRVVERDASGAAMRVLGIMQNLDAALSSVGPSSRSDLPGTPAFCGNDAGKSNDDPLPLKDGTPFTRYKPPLCDCKGPHAGYGVPMQESTKLHEADERTRIMLDATPLACNFWNSSFQNIDCNLEAAKLFMLSNKQEYLDRFFELSPKYQPNGVLSAELAHTRISTALSEGYCKFEWLHQQLDGTPVPAEITLVRVAYGLEYIVLGYTRDLRELKRKEAEVDKERQLLLKIMESSPVCFVVWVESVARFATPFATDFLGVDVGKHSASFFVDPEDHASFLEELRLYSSVNWRIVSIQGTDGVQHEMLANAFVAEYFDEPCVMTWLLDVTEMRETERQLRLARDIAEENTRAKGDFLANMSHEIRTPMNAILGMTRMVLETDLTPQQHGYLQKAEQSGRALLRILNDILDFSKIEAGKLEMEIAPFQLGDVLQGIIDMFSDAVAEKALYLTLDIDPSVPQSVQGDALRLHQILVNLISNALKFTSEGGVRVHVWVESLQAAAAIIRFAVRDTGIGLTAEQQGKIFTAFSQADTSTTRKYGGTGLGLVISKRLVEMLDGTVHCTSEQGKGAEFSFSATFLLDDTNERSDKACLLQWQGDNDSLAHLRGSRILVAEDNEMNQIIAQELLEKAGFIVDLASNGREAAEKALSTYYDLVFMDIQMPEVDGFAATRAIRQHAHLANLPIVAMTAHAMVGDKEKSLAGGMNDHITKPIDQNEVFKTLARWVKEPLHLQATFETRMGAGASPAMVPPVQETKVTEFPSSLPGIDVASGLPRVAGNKKLFVKLLRRIADEAPDTQEKISTAIMAGDITAVKEIAHSLKGAASNLSIVDVTKAAEDLEAAAKAEDFPLLLTHLDALEKAYEQYVAVVATLEGL